MSEASPKPPPHLLSVLLIIMGALNLFIAYKLWGANSSNIDGTAGFLFLLVYFIIGLGCCLAFISLAILAWRQKSHFDPVVRVALLIGFGAFSHYIYVFMRILNAQGQ
jgi:hypothetical protein